MKEDFFLREIIYRLFSDKNHSSFRDVSSNICENSFFNSPNFFSHENFFPKSILNIPGKEDVEAYLEPSRTSNMELFAKIVKGYFAVNYFRKTLHFR